MRPHAFPKAEHLCLRREIEGLFSAGNRAASAYPVRAVYRLAERTAGPPVKVLVSVSKRHLHRAVDRNRAKRQLREAYRLHKELLQGVAAPGKCLHLGFIWLADRPAATAAVEASVVRLLQRVAEKLHPDAPVPEEP